MLMVSRVKPPAQSVVERGAVPGRVDQSAIGHDRRVEIAGEVVGDPLEERAVELAGVKAGRRRAVPFVGCAGLRAHEGDLVPRLLLGDRIEDWTCRSDGGTGQRSW